MELSEIKTDSSEVVKLLQVQQILLGDCLALLEIKSLDWFFRRC